MFRILTAFCLLVGLSPLVFGQVANPADKAGASAPSATPVQGAPEKLHTWDTPPVTVYGTAPLNEEDRIGDYAQPRWTAHRVFGETRVYVIPKGMVDFEYWLKPEVGKKGEPTKFTHQYEVEFGLPYRFQLDLYAVANQTGGKGAMQFDEQKVELRWAWADWGKIPGNPTFYLEWNPRSNAPPHVEGKLLLGGQIASGWHWGNNFVFEHEAGGLQENSNEWTTGISHTVLDRKLSMGIETKYALVNEKDSTGKRGAFEKQFGIGPSMQVRPLPPMHLDFSALVGATHSAPRVGMVVVLGWEF